MRNKVTNKKLTSFSYYLVIGIMTYKIYIAAFIILFSGCTTKKKDEMLKDFYMSQKRDSILIGNYKLLTTDSSVVPYYSFEKSGNLIISSSPGFDTLNVEPKSYWYSNSDTIFILRMGNYRNQTSETAGKYNFNSTYDTLRLEFENIKNEIIITQLVRY